MEEVAQVEEQEKLKANIPKQDFDEVCQWAQQEVECNMLSVQGLCCLVNHSRPSAYGTRLHILHEISYIRTTAEAWCGAGLEHAFVDGLLSPGALGNLDWNGSVLADKGP